jgi:hypothetical protein
MVGESHASPEAKSQAECALDDDVHDIMRQFKIVPDPAQGVDHVFIMRDAGLIPSIVVEPRDGDQYWRNTSKAPASTGNAIGKQCAFVGFLEKLFWAG